jgi:hypothetical protein
MVLSIVGLASTRRAGAFFATFTLTYASAFNAFNVIYFLEVGLLNGVSAAINAVAIVYMYMASNRFLLIVAGCPSNSTRLDEVDGL